MRRVLQVALAALLAATMIVAVESTGAQATSRGGGQVELPILVAINQARAQHGLRALRLSHQLDASAASHSWSMASLGYFSHFSNDGTSFGARVSRYYRPYGYRTWRVGETLFWATPSATPGQIVDAWLASPEHRAILLSSVYRQVGLGIAHVASAPGTFAGRPVTIVTADYGIRARR